MTTTTHPIASTHHVVTALIAAAVAVGLTVALMLALSTGGSSAPANRPADASAPAITGPGFVGTVNSGPDNPTRVVSSLCSELANATPGSPAAFRLADTALGSC